MKMHFVKDNKKHLTSQLHKYFPKKSVNIRSVFCVSHSMNRKTYKMNMKKYEFLSQNEKQRKITLIWHSIVKT